LAEKDFLRILHRADVQRVTVGYDRRRCPFPGVCVRSGCVPQRAVSDCIGTASLNSMIESPGEHIMTDAFVQQSLQASPPPATAADVMRPPLTTVEQQGHVAAAAYLMKHAGATALMVLDAQTDQPIGIITEADIAHAVADGKDVNSVRISQLMTIRPTVIKTTTNVRDAAEVMTSGHFRHLPVVGDAGLVGIVDITDVCRALLEPDVSGTPESVAGHST
jgi:CBS domain-containing protein